MGDAYSDLSGGHDADRSDDAGRRSNRLADELDAEARTLRDLVWHAENWNLSITIARRSAVSPATDMLADETRWRIELASEGDGIGKTVSGKLSATGPTVTLAAERLIRQAQRLTVAHELPEPGYGEE